MKERIHQETDIGKRKNGFTKKQIEEAEGTDSDTCTNRKLMQHTDSLIRFSISYPFLSYLWIAWILRLIQTT